MAEEQTTTAQPTINPTIPKIGDYFIRGGKLYIWEIKGANTGTGLLDQGWKEYTFAEVGLFVPENVAKVGGKNMVAAPSGIVPDAFGYTLEDQREDTAYETELNKSQGKIDLKTFGNVSRPEEGGALRYPMPGDQEGGIAADGDYILFKFFDYSAPFGANRKSTDGVFDYNQVGEYKVAAGYSPIMIYMPEDISTGFKARWEGKSMSSLGVGALRALGQDGLAEKGSAGISALTDFVKRMKPLAGAAVVKAALGKLTGDALSYDDIFGGISGSILNPNTELLYSGTDMRTFTLNFKLVPRHGSESLEINRICNQFKKAVLPSKSPGKVLGSNKDGNNQGVELGFIGVPKVCQVSFMSGSSENTRLPRYKMCGITSVDVNLTPDGTYATYGDGSPVAVGLSLSFQETKICFAEEIGKSVR